MKILILAGGRGLRLWPFTDPPKQFTLYDGEHTLLQKTIFRFLKTFSPENLVILTQEVFLPLVQKQVFHISPKIQMILESKARNTAPALMQALHTFKEDVFFVAPSDHFIAPESLFLEKIQSAEKHLDSASGILFGIYPTSPHTGFGYIQCDPQASISPVTQFIEKPSLPKAKEFLEDGNWLWNSGMLLLHKKAFFQELEERHPEYLLGNCPCVSIDVAFLESFKRLKVVPLSLSWSDIGTWDAVYDFHKKDSQNNVCIGDVELLEVQNSLVFSSEYPLKAIDLENILIVASKTGILVTKRGSSQKVKTAITYDCAFSSTCSDVNSS